MVFAGLKKEQERAGMFVLCVCVLGEGGGVGIYVCGYKMYIVVYFVLFHLK